MEENQIRYKYIFAEELNSETVNTLIEIMYSYKSLDLYITTPGGCCFATEVLIDAINEHPDIRLFLCSSVASSGTFLLVDATCPVYLHKSLDFIMFHGGDRMVEGQFRKTELDYSILKEQLIDINREYAQKFKKLGLTTTQIKKYMAGEDVYLYRKDFKKLKVAEFEGN